jgi:hypothetical protein
VRHFFLAIPGAHIYTEALLGLMHASTELVSLGRGKSSNSMMAFNSLWCQLLNAREAQGFTHWVMHHTDIETEPLWADGLAELQEKHQADILSCVVRYKDDRNLTTTATLEEATGRIRRLTVTEADKLPEVFDLADVHQIGIPGDVLLVNTGLWIADAKKDWLTKVWFRQHDRIVQGTDGQWKPTSFTEDWDFSLQAHRLGLKVLGTNALRPRHHGSAVYAMKDTGTFTEDPGGSDERNDASRTNPVGNR